MRDDPFAWVVLALIAAGMVVGLSVTLMVRHETELAIRAGLQQCQVVGTSSYRWQRECR